MPSPLVVHGAAVGLQVITGLHFDPNYNYAGCRICGAVFQSNADRNPVGVLAREPRFCTVEEVNAHATELRRQWSQNHARKEHTEKEHLDLALSGAWCTPEAAYLLAAFGTIPISDGAISDEHYHALLESKPIPTDDAEE